MIITKSKRGIKMSASVSEIKNIKFLLEEDMTTISKEAWFISEFLDHDPMGDGISYEQVYDFGLTDAPGISDGNNIYAYLDYQIKDFLGELAKGETIEWIKG